MACWPFNFILHCCAFRSHLVSSLVPFSLFAQFVGPIHVSLKHSNNHLLDTNSSNFSSRRPLDATFCISSMFYDYALCFFFFLGRKETSLWDTASVSSTGLWIALFVPFANRMPRVHLFIPPSSVMHEDPSPEAWNQPNRVHILEMIHFDTLARRG